MASIANTVRNLDPTAERAKVLDPRAYVDQGYNSVKSKGDLVIENLPGYSSHAARCCANRPSLEMSFKFTGSSIEIDSVKELPYRLPKSGSPGPLLRLRAKGLWAYGYEVDDGFLVLGGSENPIDHARSTPAAIVDLRKSLLGQGVLADAGDYLVLMSDYKFPSISAAAGVMLARPVNGVEWKDEKGNRPRPRSSK